jgi:hypothetical protein
VSEFVVASVDFPSEYIVIRSAIVADSEDQCFWGYEPTVFIRGLNADKAEKR